MPPHRWQFDSRRIYVRPRTGPQSAHGQAAGMQRAYSLGQLRHGTDRQTDGRIAVSLNAPYGGGIVTDSISNRLVLKM